MRRGTAAGASPPGGRGRRTSMRRAAGQVASQILSRSSGGRPAWKGGRGQVRSGQVRHWARSVVWGGGGSFPTSSPRLDWSGLVRCLGVWVALTLQAPFCFRRRALVCGGHVDASVRVAVRQRRRLHVPACGARVLGCQLESRDRHRLRGLAGLFLIMAHGVVLYQQMAAAGRATSY